MISVKELMIGDWVEIDGKIGTVSFLDKDDCRSKSQSYSSYG